MISSKIKLIHRILQSQTHPNNFEQIRINTIFENIPINLNKLQSIHKCRINSHKCKEIRIDSTKFEMIRILSNTF